MLLRNLEALFTLIVFISSNIQYIIIYIKFSSIFAAFRSQIVKNWYFSPSSWKKVLPISDINVFALLIYQSSKKQSEFFSFRFFWKILYCFLYIYKIIYDIWINIYKLTWRIWIILLKILNKIMNCFILIRNLWYWFILCLMKFKW